MEKAENEKERHRKSAERRGIQKDVRYQESTEMTLDCIKKPVKKGSSQGSFRVYCFDTRSPQGRLFSFDFFPVFLCGLFVLVFAKGIVRFVFYRVRKILLKNIVVRVVMGIFIKLPLVCVVLAVIVLVLECARNRAAVSFADIGCGRVIGKIGGI